MAKRPSSNGCLLPHHSGSSTGSKYSRSRALTCWNCSNVIVWLHPSMAHNPGERAAEIGSPLSAKYGGRFDGCREFSGQVQHLSIHYFSDCRCDPEDKNGVERNAHAAGVF